MAPKQRMRIANEKATKNITLRGNVPKSSLCFKSSRVSEWLEDEGKKGATVHLYTTPNHLQLVDMRERLTNRFNIDCKEDRRLRETWNMAEV